MAPAHNVEVIVQASIRRLGVEDVEILPIHDLQTDLGIDSTEMVELAALIRGQLGLHTQRINLSEVITVHDLVEQVEGLLMKTAAAAAESR
jgi:acyl carrier protein